LAGLIELLAWGYRKASSSIVSHCYSVQLKDVILITQ
jgi:hypothetical protein